jgi:hypothetical protein
LESEKTDPLAIIAFILAFLLPLVGLILGIVFLVKGKSKGRGFAIAAIIISVVLMLLFLLFFVLFFVGTILFVDSISKPFSDAEVFSSSSCSASSEFSCLDYFISGDEVKISLKNNLNRNVYISSFTLKDSGSVVCSGFVPQTLSAGASRVFSFSNCNFQGKSFVSLNFDVKYRFDDSHIESTAVGRISSRMI